SSCFQTSSSASSLKTRIRIGESFSMLFSLSVASMRSDRGCMWRPLVTGAPPPHPASVICAAIADDARSARRRDRDRVNWYCRRAPIPNMTDPSPRLGLDQGKVRSTIDSASFGKQMLNLPITQSATEGDPNRSSPPVRPQRSPGASCVLSFVAARRAEAAPSRGKRKRYYYYYYYYYY